MSYNANFQKNFKHLIEKAGTNPSAYAKSIGLSVPLIYNYLSGRVSPGLDQLERIADGLGVSVPQLLGDRRPESAPPRAPTEEEMVAFFVEKSHIDKRKKSMMKVILEADELLLNTLETAFQPFMSDVGKRKKSSAG